MQEVYPNPNVTQPQPPRRFRVCLIFDMKYAGPAVCFLWLLINMYACVLSFQKRSPIYSYLNSTALIIQGIICLLFVLSAFFSLSAFSTDRPRHLRSSHRLTWTIVILFLLNYFGNLVVFGVQKAEFLYWCVDKSRQTTKNYLSSNLPSNLTLVPDAQLKFIDRNNGRGLYNCSKLWEDELKLSVIVFLILFILYIHFAICFWCYTLDRMREYQEALAFELANNNLLQQHNNNMMMNNPTMMGGQPHNIMMNLPPASKTRRLNQDNSNGKSLAQITREFFKKLRS